MDCDSADCYLFAEPPPIERLISKHMHRGEGPKPHHDIPVIIVCLNAEHAVSVAREQGPTLSKLGCHVEIISQPCGPRKLAKVLEFCLQKKKESPADHYGSTASFNDMTKGENEHIQPCEGEVQQSTHAVVKTPAVSIDSAGRPTAQRRQSLSKSLSAAVSFPSPTPLDPATPALVAPGPNLEIPA